MSIKNQAIIILTSLVLLSMNVLAQKVKTKSNKEVPAELKEPVKKEVEISREVDVAKGSTVKIVCRNQNLDIRRGADGKVKVSTKIEVGQDNNDTNEQLLEKHGINIKSLNNRVDIFTKSDENNIIYSGPREENEWSTNFRIERPKIQNIQKLRSENAMNLKKMQDVNLIIQLKQKGKIDKEIGKIKKQAEAMAKSNKLDTGDLKGFYELSNDDYGIAEELSHNLKKIENLDAWDNFKNYKLIPKMNEMLVTIPHFSFTVNDSRKNNLIIYIPSDAKIEVENQFGNINVADDYNDASINISNGTLDARKFGTLKLTSKFSTVNIGDIEDAEIEFENGSFTAGNIKQLDIDSKFSTIEFDNGSNMIIRSQNDSYNIESLDNIDGRKSYGTFRLNKLLKSFDLDGQNADIRVKNISRSVDKVKLKDRYADVRLPVKELQNYAVNFEGNYSTVYAPFEKHQPEMANSENISKEKNKSSSVDNMMVYKDKTNADRIKINKDKMSEKDPMVFTFKYNKMFENPEDKSASNFKASVGETKGTHTQFDIICNQCTVDFK